MSVTLQVFFERIRLPTVFAWQKAIEAAGFDIKLDQGVNLETHSGFWPARVAGRDAGFEYYIEAVGGKAQIGLEGLQRDTMVTLRTHGGHDEDYVAATCCAVALTQVSNGLYRDPQEGDSLLLPGPVLAIGASLWSRYNQVTGRLRRRQ